MTQQQANFIKSLKFKGCSDREIAIEYCKEYNNGYCPSEIQELGPYLCDKAQHTLKEEFVEGWD